MSTSGILRPSSLRTTAMSSKEERKRSVRAVSAKFERENSRAAASNGRPASNGGEVVVAPPRRIHGRSVSESIKRQASTAITMAHDGRARWQLDPPHVTRLSFLLCGILIVVSNVVFIVDLFMQKGLCTINCLGPALVWDDFTGGENDEQNLIWRQVFSLNPNEMFLNWAGFLVGTLMIMIQIEGYAFYFLTRTWVHIGLFCIFALLFGAFPYGGNLGVIVGFLTLGVAMVAFILHFTSYKEEPTTLHLELNKYTYGFFVDNELIPMAARGASFAAGVMIIIAGCIHMFVSTVFNMCPGGDPLTNECIGPSLRWNPSGTSFIHDINDSETGWRSVFTFRPDFFFPFFGPLILGITLVLQHVEGWTSRFIFGSWLRVFFFMVFLMLFSGFGYAGNFGIVTGFVCMVGAVLALMLHIGGAVEQPTSLNIVIPYCHPRRLLEMMV